MSRNNEYCLDVLETGCLLPTVLAVLGRCELGYHVQLALQNHKSPKLHYGA